MSALQLSKTALEVTTYLFGVPFPSSLNRSGHIYHVLNSLKAHFITSQPLPQCWIQQGRRWVGKSRAVRHEEKKKQAFKVLSKQAVCGVQRPPQVHCCCSPSHLSVLAHQYCSTCHSHRSGIKLNIYLWQRARRGCITINSLKESFPMIYSSLSSCCTYLGRRGPRAQHPSTELDS